MTIAQKKHQSDFKCLDAMNADTIYAYHAIWALAYPNLRYSSQKWYFHDLLLIEEKQNRELKLILIKEDNQEQDQLEQRKVKLVQFRSHINQVIQTQTTQICKYKR